MAPPLLFLLCSLWALASAASPSPSSAPPRPLPLGFSAAHRATAAAAAARGGGPLRGIRRHPAAPPAALDSCSVRYFATDLDHFSFALPEPEKLQLRFFVCTAAWTKGGPVFFYAGNEADVELYVNHTGLMWESAPEFGALLVFAEHRYYGLSVPQGWAPGDRPTYLSAEQALADYAALLYSLKTNMSWGGEGGGGEGGGGPADGPGPSAPAVVAFGGSYGGMLAAWLRIHYPSAVDGAVAASAPVWGLAGLAPPPDAGAFAAAVTADAPPACAAALRAAWPALFALAAAGAGGATGRRAAAAAARLCPADADALAGDAASAAPALELAYYLQAAWDFLAMGDFPYASDYLTNGEGTLPAWPVRAACAHLSDPTLPTGPPEALVAALASAAATFYNASGSAACLSPSAGAGGATARDGQLWDWQACTALVMPMSRDGVRDAFWPQPWDGQSYSDDCAARLGAPPRAGWAAASFGGRRLAATSNIHFSNGELDPWRPTGVVRPPPGAPPGAITTVLVAGGAHHLDLMFSHPDDPRSVVAARREARRAVGRWVAQAMASPEGGGAPGCGGPPFPWLRPPAPVPRPQLLLAAAAGACATAFAAAAALAAAGRRGGGGGGAAGPRRPQQQQPPQADVAEGAAAGASSSSQPPPTPLPVSSSPPPPPRRAAAAGWGAAAAGAADEDGRAQRAPLLGRRGAGGADEEDGGAD